MKKLFVLVLSIVMVFGCVQFFRTASETTMVVLGEEKPAAYNEMTIWLNDYIYPDNPDIEAGSVWYQYDGIPIGSYYKDQVFGKPYLLRNLNM